MVAANSVQMVIWVVVALLKMEELDPKVTEQIQERRMEEDLIIKEVPVVITMLAQEIMVMYIEIIMAIYSSITDSVFRISKEIIMPMPDICSNSFRI